MFLKNTYKCKGGIAKNQYVDCKHWSVDVTKCQTICSLKVINNPSVTDCSTCPHRESYKTRLILESKEVESQEEQIEEKPFMEKAKSYAKAETSQMVQGKVSHEIFEKRKSICMNCEYRVPKTREFVDEIGWCKGGCGCSVGNRRAALSQKLYMPTLSCPKGKFGPEKGEGFNVSDVVDSVKGIVTSVKNLFEKDK